MVLGSERSAGLGRRAPAHQSATHPATPSQASWAQGRGGSMRGSRPGHASVPQQFFLAPCGCARDDGRLGRLGDVCDAKAARDIDVVISKRGLAMTPKSWISRLGAGLIAL